MSKPIKRNKIFSRRKLIGGAAAAGSVGLAKLAIGSEANPDNLPPNIPEWTPYLGGGRCEPLWNAITF